MITLAEFFEHIKMMAVNEPDNLNCSGCGRQFSRFGELNQPIYGQRINGLHGGLIPDKEFTWCLTCARVAFGAVRDFNSGRNGNASRSNSDD